jgi:hypothetical protein
MARPLVERIAVMHDNYLYRVLKLGGEIVRDEEGNVIMVEGKPLREISIPLLSAIERRMHHAGVSKVKKANNDRSLSAVFQELKKDQRLQIPITRNMNPVPKPATKSVG